MKVLHCKIHYFDAHNGKSFNGNKCQVKDYESIVIELWKQCNGNEALKVFIVGGYQALLCGFFFFFFLVIQTQK